MNRDKGSDRGHINKPQGKSTPKKEILPLQSGQMTKIGSIFPSMWTSFQKRQEFSQQKVPFSGLP
jgi:hypothetical protein